MALDPKKGRAALRRGRVSIPGAEYFLTVCNEDRRADLTATDTLTNLLSEIHSMNADSTWRLRSAVVMPDHLHLLVVLGSRLPLGKTISRLKSKTSAALAASQAALKWERDFYDHRLRPEDDRFDVFLYLFLNPYRAGLCTRAERWPGYYCCDEDWEWLRTMLDRDRPAPEWLG